MTQTETWNPDTPGAQEALGAALSHGEIDVHFQPQVDLTTGRTGAVEALARWRSARFGVVEPASFTALAERTGAIEPLTNLVLARALALQRRATAAGFPLRVAVNIAVASLPRGGLVQRLGQALADAEVPASALELEITESSIMNEPETTARVLGALRSLGVGLALDDFGTGYSSLSRLHSLPIDEIKIDRSFVAEMRRTGDAGLLRLIADMAHRLDYRIVAEGAETKDDVLSLAGIGCHMVQGFYFSPALPEHELLPWLEIHAGREGPPRPARRACDRQPGGPPETLSRRIHRSMDQLMPTAPDASQAAATALAALGAEIGARLASFWVVDPQAPGLLRCHETWHAPRSSVPAWEETTLRSTFTRGRGLPGAVWDAGEPCWVELSDTDRFPRMAIAADAGHERALVFPLWGDEHVVGVVELVGRALIPDTKTTRRTLHTVGRRLGQHVLRRLAEREAAAAVDTLDRAAAAARRIAETESATVAHTELCAALCDLTGASAACVWHVGLERRSLELVGCAGWEGPPTSLSLSETSGAATAFASGEPVFISDVATSPVVSPGLVKRLGSVSAYYEPIVGSRGTIGALAISWPRHVPRPDATTRQAVALLAAQASLTLAPFGSPLEAPSLS